MEKPYDSAHKKKLFQELFSEHLSPFLKNQSFKSTGMKFSRRKDDFIHIIEICRSRWNTGIAYSFGVDITIFFSPGEKIPSYHTLLTEGIFIIKQGITSNNWPDTHEIILNDWKNRKGIDADSIPEIPAETMETSKMVRSKTQAQYPQSGLTPYSISAHLTVASLAHAVMKDLEEQAFTLFNSMTNIEQALEETLRRNNPDAAARLLVKCGRNEEAKSVIDQWDAPSETKEHFRNLLKL